MYDVLLVLDIITENSTEAVSGFDTMEPASSSLLAASISAVLGTLLIVAVAGVSVVALCIWMKRSRKQIVLQFNAESSIPMSPEQE